MCVCECGCGWVGVSMWVVVCSGCNKKSSREGSIIEGVHL